MGYSNVNVRDIEPAAPGGAVRFVRRQLGVEAFGINWFEIPANGEEVPFTAMVAVGAPRGSYTPRGPF